MTTTPTPITPLPRARASQTSAAPRPRPPLQAGRLLMYGLLLIAALFFLLPVYLLLVTAFKTPDAINLTTAWRLPAFLNWGSFADAWAKVGGNMVNSLVLAVSGTLLSAIIGSLNGYALAKWKFRGANTLFALMLFGMFIPYQSVLIPLFQFIQSIGLYGRLRGLILAHVV
ncbi:MAG: carbohydrate ABC transporter permease, partial [Deinococcus sp.]